VFGFPKKNVGRKRHYSMGARISPSLNEVLFFLYSSSASLADVNIRTFGLDGDVDEVDEVDGNEMEQSKEKKAWSGRDGDSNDAERE
ncbi:hypothetical protein TRV_04535, partial [Trichophyton verrucosum HKI 0517]